MNKLIIVFLFLGLFFNSVGQSSPDCFTQTKQDAFNNVQGLGLGNKTKSDSTLIGSISRLRESTFKKLIGCELPDTMFISYEGKLQSVSDQKTKYTIVHFNTVYCDVCSQLDQLAILKKGHKSDLTIILFYFDSKKDIQQIIDKYKNDFIIVPDSRPYYDKYSWGQGYPLNYLLDKDKAILEGDSGNGNVYGKFELLMSK